METLEESPADFVPLRLTLQPDGLCVELTRSNLVIGRHTEADVRLGFPDVSRRHCRCVFAHGKWRIEDLDSLNGLYINGERIHEAYLYDGDRLRLGGLEITVSLVNQPSIVPMPTRSPAAEVLQSIAEILPSAGERKAS